MMDKRYVFCLCSSTFFNFFKLSSLYLLYFEPASDNAHSGRTSMSSFQNDEEADTG